MSSTILVKQEIDKQTLSVFIRDLAADVNVNLKHMIEDIILKKDKQSNVVNMKQKKKPVIKKKDIIIQQQNEKRAKIFIEKDIQKIRFLFKNLSKDNPFEPIQTLQTKEGILHYKSQLLQLLWKDKKNNIPFITILYYHLKEQEVEDKTKEILERIKKVFKDDLVKQLMMNDMGDMLEPLCIYDKQSHSFDPWQEEVIQNIKEHKSIIVKARTSSGKSWVAMAAGIIHRKILYICPAKPVAYQVGAHFIHMGYKVHFLVDNLSHHSYDSKTNIYIGTPKEIENNLIKDGITYDYAVFDEIHNVNKEDDGDIYENIIKLLPCNFLALSATIGNIEFLQEVFHKIHPEKEISYVEYNKRFINQQRWIWNQGSLCKLHPLCAIDTINESFKDVHLSMTPHDCASLWDTIEEEFDGHDREDYIDTFSPDNQFVEDRLLTLEDCKQYEITLQQLLIKLHTEYPTKVQHILNSFKGPSFETSDVDISNMVDFIHTIGTHNMFPMIMFHTDKYICKDIFHKLFEYLETNELEEYPYHYDILEKKEELYQKYIEKKKSFEINITVSKKSTDAINEKTEKINQFILKEKENYYRQIETYYKHKLHDIQRSDVMDELKIRQTNNLRKEMNTFLGNPDFCSQDIFKKHPKFIFSVTNEPMSADTIRNVRREIMKTLNIKISYDHYIFQLLKRGIGLYIEDMPDEYNWIIQKLLSKKQIAVIISDKTLCLGIDLPVRTSCFIKGCDYTNEEYVQMSGRAGRRGKDNQGNIVFYENENYIQLMQGILPNIHGSNIPIYSHYKILPHQYHPEKAFTNMIHKDRQIIECDYNIDPQFNKLTWALRKYKDISSFINKIKPIESTLFSLDERETYKYVLDMISELLEDKEHTVYQCYLSKKIEIITIDKMKEYINVFLTICNTLHPKKYFILHKISKEIFTLFNDLVFRSFIR
jgi:superfamily II RNA helicase